MGQKVNPHGLRVGVIKNWDSRWFAKDNVFGDTLVEDYKLRNYLLKLLEPAGVPKVEIERDIKIDIAIPSKIPYTFVTDETERLKIIAKISNITNKDKKEGVLEIFFFLPIF